MLHRRSGRTVGPVEADPARGAPQLSGQWEMPDAIDVVLVEAPACHLCHDASEALDDAARSYRLAVRRVDIASPEGRAVVRQHRAPMPPVVVVDGELLGWGRLSRGKLRRRLEALAGVGATDAVVPRT